MNTPQRMVWRPGRANISQFSDLEPANSYLIPQIGPRVACLFFGYAMSYGVSKVLFALWGSVVVFFGA